MKWILATDIETCKLLAFIIARYPFEAPTESQAVHWTLAAGMRWQACISSLQRYFYVSPLGPQGIDRPSSGTLPKSTCIYKCIYHILHPVNEAQRLLVPVWIVNVKLDDSFRRWFHIILIDEPNLNILIETSESGPISRLKCPLHCVWWECC